MDCFKFALVIVAFVGYVSAKGYNIGTRPTGNVPGQPGTAPGSGGGMRPDYGGGMKPGNGGGMRPDYGGGMKPANGGGMGPGNVGGMKLGNGGGMRPGYGIMQPNLVGGNPGEIKQSKIGGGLPSIRGGNYGPISQTPVGVDSSIGGEPNIGSRPGGRPEGRPGGRPGYGINGGQVPKPEETYPPRPFNMDYNIVDEQGNVQFRQEEGDGEGIVRGIYGYRNTQGLYRTVEYEANKDGFRAVVKTNEPGTDGSQNPADVVMNVEQTPAGIQEQYNTGRNGGGNQPPKVDQGRNQNNYNRGADQIGNIGGPGGPSRPMSGMKPNKGSPDLSVGVNPGRNQNNYNRGADQIGIIGGPGGPSRPMPGMKQNKVSPDLPVGVNPGTQPRNYNSGVRVEPQPGRNPNIGNPGGPRPPMSGMKAYKGSPDLPAGVNAGGPQKFEQTSYEV